MSDFTFTPANAGGQPIADWSRGILPGSSVANVGPPPAYDMGDRPRASRSASAYGLNHNPGSPPIGMQARPQARQAMSDVNATPRGGEFTAGRGQFTARAGVGVETARHVQPSPMPQHVTSPPPPDPRGRSRRRDPTPYPTPLTHQEARDLNSVERRGYVASEAGDTALDDPVPAYRSRPSSYHGSVPPPPPAGRTGQLSAPSASGRQEAEMSGALSRADVMRQDLHPGDSISSVGFVHDVPSPRRHRRDSATSVSTRSTVSLSDSSVDRVVDKLAATGLGGVASRRRTLDTVPEEAATSARNRRHHRMQHVSPGRETLTAGAKLMLGAQEVRRDSRGNLVLVRPKGWTRIS